jgi:hypothetical protein
LRAGKHFVVLEDDCTRSATRNEQAGLFPIFVKMKKLCLLLAIIAVPLLSDAKGKPKPKVEQSRFQKELSGIVDMSKRPGGFESLKQVELTTGRWSCNRELEGFIPVVEVNGWHPADRLQLLATSVKPVARQHAQMLLLHGLPGYIMRDSDKDASVSIDKAIYARKVVFTKSDNYMESTVTVAFKAHNLNTVEILVEAWKS